MKKTIGDPKGPGDKDSKIDVDETEQSKTLS
jgi:hypothetical protein